MNLTSYKLTFKLLKPLARLYFKKRGKKDPRYLDHLPQRFDGKYDLTSEILKQYERFGSIHIHAASLGEVNLISNFVKKIVSLQLDQSINPKLNQSPIIVSTNTPTGLQAGIKLAQDCQNLIKDFINKNVNNIPNFNFACLKNIEHLLNQWVQVVYLPLELTPAIQNFIKCFNPNVTYLTETEIWPLFINLCSKHHSVNIINGRLSDKYYKYYSKNPISDSLKQLDHIITQSSYDKFIYVCLLLGLTIQQMQEHWYEFKKANLNLDLNNPISNKIIDQYFQSNFSQYSNLTTKIINGQNLKYCKNNITATEIIKQTKLKNSLLTLELEQTTAIIHKIKPFLLIASTYPNELKLILEVLKQNQLLTKYNLVIAPRHPENFTPIEHLIATYQPQFTKFSDFKEKFYTYQSLITTNSANTETQVLIQLCQIYDLFNQDLTQSNFNSKDSVKNINITLVNTLGDLSNLYPFAHLCIIGGTFNEVGGHDLLEAIGYKVPLIIGPNYKSQQTIVDDFCKLNTLQIINCSASLKHTKDRKVLTQNLLTDTCCLSSLGQILTDYCKLDVQFNYMQTQAQNAFDFYLKNQLALTNHLADLNIYHEQQIRTKNSNFSC